MTFRLTTCLACAVLMAGCATQTIVPSYDTTNPDLRIGGERPDDAPPRIENAGSFCLEVTEKWHLDGKTPDGTALWARDTLRRVAPCAG
ncbi:MAG: hypothetical protein RLW61_09220 [Gammaproteobacteria bacterium]